MYGSGYDRTLARRELARTEAQAALAEYAGLPDAHLALGYYWLNGHGDDDRALHAFTRALSGLPNSSELLAAIARIHRGRGRWSDAAAGFARAFALDSNDLSVAADLALTYSSLRRYADAARVWDHVIELAPENHNAKLSKGYVFRRIEGSVDTLAAALRACRAQTWLGAGYWIGPPACGITRPRGGVKLREYQARCWSCLPGPPVTVTLM